MTLRSRGRNKPRWRNGSDFRIVCDCQRHRRKATWQRVASRAAALILGVPLAILALDFPTIEAMNLKIESLRGSRPVKVVAATAAETRATVMPIFTTPAAREQFLNPQPQRLTLEIAKEQFFRSQVPYGAIIYREAMRNNLPPELVAAVVHTESDFRVGLKSHKNAQGLMQIVPETARLLGVNDPFDPHQNIAAGTKYLRYLMDRFPDQRLALAAYNAGETKVARLGTIPQYEETISYIEKVNRRTTQYRQRVRRSYLAASRIRGAY